MALDFNKPSLIVMFDAAKWAKINDHLIWFMVEGKSLFYYVRS